MQEGRPEVRKLSAVCTYCGSDRADFPRPHYGYCLPELTRPCRQDLSVEGFSQSMFKKIEVSRVRLADQIYDQIVTAIDQGLIAPAERIVQEKLAEQLQVSRTPIREALFRLEQEGILIATERGGFSIRQIDPREVVEIYEARQAIEGHSAAMLARNCDSERLERIQTIIDKNETAFFETISEYYSANRQIHQSFVAATDNKYLLEMFEAMWNRSLSFGIFRLMNPEQLGLTLNGHSQLLAAVRTGNPEVAMRTMCEHISAGKNLQLSAPSLLGKNINKLI